MENKIDEIKRKEWKKERERKHRKPIGEKVTRMNKAIGVAYTA